MKKLVLVFLLLSGSAFAASWVRERNPKIYPTGFTGFTHAESVESYIAYVDPLPAAYDSRMVIANFPAVKNQGNCGSCWAFGSTAAFEIGLRMLGNLDSLSEQELVSCDRSFYGCGGGGFAHDYQQSRGQSLASEFPYVARNVRCKPGLSDKDHVASWGMVSGMDQIKAAIMKYGSVSADVYADNNFMSYKSGTFDTCRNRGTNHLIALVGWNADGSWILRNSWGRNWGMDGYMNIQFGCNSVANEAAYVEVIR